MNFDEFLDSRLAALLRYATVISCDPHHEDRLTLRHREDVRTGCHREVGARPNAHDGSRI